MPADPRAIIQQVAAKYGIGSYSWIPTAIAYGESGLNPSKIWSDPTDANPNATAGGLFAYHDDGRGRGWGDRRKDPWAITEDVMPAMAKAIKQGTAAGLQGLELLKHVWFTVEVPANTPQAHKNMENAYQVIMGGGEPSMPPDPTLPPGTQISQVGSNQMAGAPATAPSAAGPTPPQGYEWALIPGADPEDPSAWRLVKSAKTPEADTPAQTTNANANMLSSSAQWENTKATATNAISNKIAALMNAAEMWIKNTQGATAEDGWKHFQADLARQGLLQDWEKASGTFAQNASEQNLSRANMMNADARQREIEEANRKVNLQQTATQRASSAARDILPFSVPGATSMTLPLLGEMPLPQVNMDQFYSQGLPSLQEQWNNPIAGAAPNPWPDPTVAPQMSPLALPQLPAAQPAPDIEAILAKILGYA